MKNLYRFKFERNPKRFLTILLGIFFLVPLDAAVTVDAWYRLGEGDGGSALGGAASTSSGAIIDSSGNGFHLTLSSAGPTYASPVSSPQGSTLAMNFSGGVAQSASGVLANTLTDNFGIEAFVNIHGGGDATLFENGDGSLNGGVGGYRLVYLSGKVEGIYNGVAYIDPGITAPTNTWVHYAIVRENGLTTFYINGVAAMTSAAGPALPNGKISIGNSTNIDMDEARLFHFGAGQFSSSDLLYAAIPEASTSVGFALSVVLLVLTLRRARNSVTRGIL